MDKIFCILFLLLSPQFILAQVILATPGGGILSTSDGTILQTEPPCGILVVTDVDDNSYNTVAIGTQCWLDKNLATTRYNDGTTIPGQSASPSGQQYVYLWGDQASNKATYGLLYNWYAVDNNPATSMASNGGKNVCPDGWHVPGATEWDNLANYLGGAGVAGGKMKSVTGWTGTNVDATNSSGFTALPGGVFSGGFWNKGTQAYFWSTYYQTRALPNAKGYSFDVKGYYLDIGYGGLSLVGWATPDTDPCTPNMGFSVRCIKDQ
jgi:uncharacterized protein (TIGR02145 family)